ncbi:GNAT family N-acetyltransferase [Anaerosporobacter sp.]
MIKLNEVDYIKLSELCSYRKNDIMLSWFLEGNPSCAAWVDNIEQPEEAIIIAADFCYLLGEIKHPDETKQILETYAQHKIINSCETQWVTYLKENLSDKLHFSKRYSIKHEPNAFDKNNLKQLIEKVVPEYEIKSIDEEIYNEVLNIDWAADGCCFYRSYDDFKENGLGYVAFKDGELISIASSYNTYKSTISVTIGTLDDYRRRGIAAACAASLILECLKRGIYPEWESANMASVALSEKLGYHLDKEYDIYYLR